MAAHNPPSPKESFAKKLLRVSSSGVGARQGWGGLALFSFMANFSYPSGQGGDKKRHADKQYND
jgi:hypothetical protein